MDARRPSLLLRPLQNLDALRELLLLGARPDLSQPLLPRRGHVDAARLHGEEAHRGLEAVDVLGEDLRLLALRDVLEDEVDLAEMQLALEPAAFDPAASDRRFALAVNNYAAVVLAPPLVAAVSAAAPGVYLDLQPSGTLDIVERLDRGDAESASIATASSRFVLPWPLAPMNTLRPAPGARSR